MSKIEMLRLLINQRLTAAAEEIFGVFGRTIAEYEEELSRFRLLVERQRRLLELSRKPRVSLEVDNSAVSEQQVQTGGLDLDKEESAQIKEEEEEQDVGSELQDEILRVSEHNDVNFMLFQRSRVRERDSTCGVSSDLEFPGPDLKLDPPSGSSDQATYSNLSEDEPGASDLRSGDGQFDSVELEMAASEIADSYICTICGQAFAQRRLWVKHVQMHRNVDPKDDKSFVCDICGKRLTRFDGYQKHLRVHTGEKPYCCDVCGRRFSDNSNYKRHVRTHTVQNSQQSSA